VICQATILEWPQIEALALPYYQEKSAIFMMDIPDTVWWIARIGERVVGCYRSFDRIQLGQRTVQDFHRVPGRIGLAAFLSLKDHVFSQADEDGLDLMFWVASDDHAMKSFVNRYTDAELVSLVYLRREKSSNGK